MTRSPRFLIGAVAVAMVLSFVAGPALHKASRKARAGYMSATTGQTLERRNESAFGRILGEIRATVSDFMFVKANAYMHVGVRYVKGMRTDALDQEAEQAACGPGIPTAIRSAAEDFRGFLGDLERDVKPYRDPSLGHIHTSQTEILPWYRVMTLANPRFVRGYRAGAFALSQQGQFQEAREFLLEGIAKNEENPEKFLLYQNLAYVYTHSRNEPDLPWSNEWLERALDCARKAYESGKRYRPPGGPEADADKARKQTHGMVWSHDHEEDFAMSAGLYLRLLILRHEASGDPLPLREAVEKGREMRRIMPRVGPINRSLEEAEQLLARAEETRE